MWHPMPSLAYPLKIAERLPSRLLGICSKKKFLVQDFLQMHGFLITRLLKTYVLPCVNDMYRFNLFRLITTELMLQNGQSKPSKIILRQVLLPSTQTFQLQNGLLDQAFLTLNLLRPARANTSLSAQAYLFGQFDYNVTPIEPPGTKVLVHSKPDNRGSWDPNGKVGWYVGPSPHHYRCMRCYIPSFRAEVDSDTIVFFPHEIPFPTVTIESFLRQAALDIIIILTNPPSPSLSPTLEAGDATRNALLQLANILNRNPLTPSKLKPLFDRSAVAAANLEKQATSPPFTKTTAPNIGKYPLSSKVPCPSSQSNRVTITREQLARVLNKETEPSRPSIQPSKLSHPSLRHRAVQHLLAQHVFSPHMQHIYDSKGRRRHLHHLL